MLVTADTLLFFRRCRRRPFLEAYGDRTWRDAPSGFMQKLGRDSAAYQARVVARWGLAAVHPDYAPGDWAAGAAATEDLMAAGAELIVRGVLRSQEIPETTLLAIPTLLLRQPGASIWGDWHYVPLEIRLGKKPKQEYQLILTFAADLLAAVQGTLPERAGLVLRDSGLRQRDPYWIEVRSRLDALQDTLADLLAVLAGAEAPELFVSRNRCSLCPWLGHCTEEARQTGHLSLLPGVTPARLAALATVGLGDAAGLAAADPAKLAEFPELAPVAKSLVWQAIAQRDRQPYLLPIPHGAYRCGGLPSSAVEVYFDLEAAPDLDLDYLHGILVVDRQDPAAPQEHFESFLAEQPQDEASQWQAAIACLERYGDAPIYHFCDYEVRAFDKLADRYGLEAGRRARLRSRFWDLHAWLTHTVVLPTEGYALKQIAQYLGFRWRDAQANGSQAVYWYDRWLREGDREALAAIVAYNEDDCRATHVVKTWLVEFWAANAPPYAPGTTATNTPIIPPAIA